jgi:hypothetical protein
MVPPASMMTCAHEPDTLTFWHAVSGRAGIGVI